MHQRASTKALLDWPPAKSNTTQNERVSEVKWIYELEDTDREYDTPHNVFNEWGEKHWNKT